MKKILNWDDKSQMYTVRTATPEEENKLKEIAELMSEIKSFYYKLLDISNNTFVDIDTLIYKYHSEYLLTWGKIYTVKQLSEELGITMNVDAYIHEDHSLDELWEWEE